MTTSGGPARDWLEQHEGAAVAQIPPDPIAAPPCDGALGPFPRRRAVRICRDNGRTTLSIRRFGPSAVPSPPGGRDRRSLADDAPETPRCVACSQGPTAPDPVLARAAAVWPIHTSTDRTNPPKRSNRTKTPNPRRQTIQVRFLNRRQPIAPTLRHGVEKGAYGSEINRPETPRRFCGCIRACARPSESAFGLGTSAFGRWQRSGFCGAPPTMGNPCRRH